MNMDKISVVIPIYNVEKYLRRCIDSVISQTYQNIEIILVDDGSPDRCGEICDQYLTMDKRVVVVHQENRGLSEARNSGITKATGNYIAFVDSDDYVDKNMLEILHNNIVKYNADISCCGHMDVYEGRNIDIPTNTKEMIRVYNTEQAMETFLYTKEIDVVAWNKLYKMELFDGIRYMPGKLFEDHFTTYKILDRAGRIVNTNLLLYYYCKRSTSIGGSSFTDRNYELKEALDKEVPYIINKYPNIESEVSIAYLTWLVVLYDKILLAEKNDDSLLHCIRGLVRKYFLKIITSNKMGSSKKIQLLLLGFNKQIYFKFYSWFISKYR